MSAADTLDIVLDRASPTPQYQQIRAQLQSQIENGRLRPGTRLPGSRTLAAALGVARVSVVTAYQQLEQAHLLESYARRGLFVAGALDQVLPIRRALHDGDYSDLADLMDSAEAGGADRFPDLIQFSLGSLPPEFVPVDAMRAALRRAIERDPDGVLGHESTEGYDPLRRAIAGWVAPLGIAVTSDEVLITGGCQQAIDLVVQALVPHGGVILSTDPTYIGLIAIASARGLDLLTVPYEGGQLDFDLLATVAETRNPRLFYMMPTFQNPTGASLSTTGRRQLLAWSARYHIPILEDGVYDGLSYGQNTLQPLKALDDQGQVLYASGFSKTVAPGSRIGYLLVGERLRGRISRIKQAADVGTPGLQQRALTDLITTGVLSVHLEKVRRACQLRRDVFLREWPRLFAGWSYSVPQGGLYLWATMPANGPRAAQFAIEARRLGVDFASGADFSPTGQDRADRQPDAIRLNFATQPPAVISEGLRRLQQAYDRLV